MTVIFGDSNTVSGSGEWDYPHAGTVIGLLLELVDAASLPFTYGNTILRNTHAGVYAPVTEAGRMHALPIWNDESVTYDIGHSPTGVAWDLGDGSSVTFTEILSEVPSGGGGAGVSGYGQIGGYCAITLPDWNGPDITWCSYDSGSWTGTDAFGIVVPANTFYHFSLTIRVTFSGAQPDALGMQWQQVSPDAHSYNYLWETAWPVSETSSAQFFQGIVSDNGGKIPAGAKILPHVWSIGGGTVTADFVDLFVVSTNA